MHSNITANNNVAECKFAMLESERENKYPILITGILIRWALYHG